MDVSQRRIGYGLVIGAATFLAGWIVIHLMTPVDVLPDVPRWKTTLWLFISAHFVTISGLQPGGLMAEVIDVEAVAQLPELPGQRVVPALLTVIGGLLMVDAVDDSTRFVSLLQNSGSLLVGYLSTALVVFILSEVELNLMILVVLGVIVSGAAVIGGIVVQGLSMNVPVVVLVVLGGVVMLGLLVILAGSSVVQSIGPMVGVSLAGVTVAAVLAWLTRNASA